VGLFGGLESFRFSGVSTYPQIEYLLWCLKHNGTMSVVTLLCRTGKSRIDYPCLYLEGQTKGPCEVRVTHVKVGRPFQIVGWVARLIDTYTGLDSLSIRLHDPIRGTDEAEALEAALARRTLLAFCMGTHARLGDLEACFVSRMTPDLLYQMVRLYLKHQ
jgi:hypothetical protein